MALTRGGETPTIYFGVDSSGRPKEVNDIYLGSKLVYTSKVEPVEFPYTSAGTFTLTVPFDNAEADVFLLGGGGGGDAGNGGTGASGSGGTAGSIDTTSLINLTRGLELTLKVGAGGKGGSGSSRAPGSDGGATQLIVNGVAMASGAGGIGGGNSSSSGQSYHTAPSSHGVDHQVVADDSLGGSGAGGSGGFFNSYSAGKSGKNGYAWVRIRKVMPK